jgi:hypothetical protein
MTHPYMRIPVPVRACASMRTDPNTRTGMSITGNGILRVLVPAYARFCLKSQVLTEEIINCLSFEFTCLGGLKIYKNQMQAMKMETPMMLLFVYNGTNQSSIMSGIKQMLELALNNIEVEGMMPKEFENCDIPAFTLKLNESCFLEKESNQDNRAYDQLREQGKKAFHFKVAKSDTTFFKYLACHAHRMKLDTKYFGKFAKFIATLGNNAPLSDCTHLQRCFQGHLNFHLSCTSVTINGIDMRDATKTLRNTAKGSSIACLSFCDLLYQIQLENKSPLFLQLSQCPTGEVDAVILNTPEAELMVERMNVQIAAWRHFYWKGTNPRGERFYRKLADRVFSQILLHEISKCQWDAKSLLVTLPNAFQAKLSAVMEFENQDWVKTYSTGQPN